MAVTGPGVFLKENNQIFFNKGNLLITDKSGKPFTSELLLEAINKGIRKDGVLLKPAPYGLVYKNLRRFTHSDREAVCESFSNGEKPINLRSNYSAHIILSMTLGEIIAYPESKGVFVPGQDIVCSYSKNNIPASSVPQQAFREGGIAIKFSPESASPNKQGGVTFEADPKTVEIIRNFPQESIIYTYHDAKDGVKYPSGLFLDSPYSMHGLFRNKEQTACPINLELYHSAADRGEGYFGLLINLHPVDKNEQHPPLKTQGITLLPLVETRGAPKTILRNVRVDPAELNRHIAELKKLDSKPSILIYAETNLNKLIGYLEGLLKQ